MKKLLFLCLALIISVVISACGNSATDIKQSDDEKAKAKTEESETTEETASSDESESKKEDDIWTYYNDATWTDDYEGLKQTIQKVVVSDEAPALDDDGKEITKSAVGIKMQIENTTEGKFVTYPDQATLVTSTGEQVEADMYLSDHLGGEIDKGVIKEGNVIFYLERGHAADIEWVKFEWTGHEGGDDDFDSDTKTWETEIKLK